jgi:hypothetical protein
MEREHLIIIALILVALYMMNKDTKDTVKAISPMGRIRYTDPSSIENLPFGHIRTREGFFADNDGTQPLHIRTREGFFADNDGTQPLHIRIRGDKDYGQGHFIKHHVRHNNRNNMFSGMMGDCVMPPKRETFRMDADNSSQDNIGEQHIRGGLWV